MNKVQLKIDIDAETKQRVEAAAAEKKLSVNEYLLESVHHQLIQDGQLQPKQAGSVSRPIYDSALLEEIDRLRSEILERRGGELIDVDAFIDLVRDERDAELYNLR
jgi:hypothetical protein